MQYLQYFTLQHNRLTHFGCWASTFKTITATKFAPDKDTGFQVLQLKSIMTIFKEMMDITVVDLKWVTGFSGEDKTKFEEISHRILVTLVVS